ILNSLTNSGSEKLFTPMHCIKALNSYLRANPMAEVFYTSDSKILIFPVLQGSFQQVKNASQYDIKL
ncbi:TPA: hypothetical protein ACNHMP_004847, partial [Klebsiella pneumoniae]